MLPHASILLLHKETATDRNHHYMLQLQWGDRDGGWHNGQRGGFYGTTAVAMGWSGAKMHAGLRTLIAPRALRRRVMLDAPTFQGIYIPFPFVTARCVEAPSCADYLDLSHASKRELSVERNRNAKGCPNVPCTWHGVG